MSNNSYEKDYNLEISKYIYNRFKELGIPVVLTRDSDVTLNPTDRINKVLNAFGNDEDVIVISNHLNAGGVKDKNGGIELYNKVNAYYKK